MFSPNNPLIHIYTKKAINIGLQRAHSPTLEEESNKYVTFYDIFSNVISRKPITENASYIMYIMGAKNERNNFSYIQTHHCEMEK